MQAVKLCHDGVGLCDERSRVSRQELQVGRQLEEIREFAGRSWCDIDKAAVVSSFGKRIVIA